MPARPPIPLLTPVRHKSQSVYVQNVLYADVLYIVGNIETSDRKQQMVTLKHFLNIINIYSTVCASVSN